jgi:membrane associated rhomboid family serine protease
MFPIRDNVPRLGVPVVNTALIMINVVVFVCEASLGDRGLERLFGRYALTPYELTHGESVPPELIELVAEFRQEFPRLSGGRRLDPGVSWRQIVASPEFEYWLFRRGYSWHDFPSYGLTWAERLLPLLTCMFLHGGWLHLLGNMWVLYIFGDNVEDRLGRWRYLAFYLSCGLSGSVLQVMVSPDSPVPSVGASGAIAGVMGAYLLMFPQASVLAAVPIFFFLTFLEVPAAVFLGVWVLLQLFQGVAALGPAAEVGGVAWFAHVGGFAAGVAWVLLMPTARHEGSWIHRYRPFDRHLYSGDRLG